jgi:hypothetical protein
MSFAMVAALSYSLYATDPTSAASDAARAVDAHRRGVLDRLADSATFGLRPVLDDLQDLAWDAHFDGWDGQGSQAVTEDLLAAAEQFVHSLPLGLSLPLVGVDPDGAFNFEWYRTPTWTLSVSVSADGWLHYAALFGASSESGRVPFLGDCPTQVLRLISRVRHA